jgi:hypothetical protein
LIVLDQNGNVVETWTGPNINGPWDMTETSSGGSAELYLSDVLGVDATGNIPTSGPCDVVRIDLKLGSGAPTMTGSTIIGSAFPWKDSPSALVQGNTGVALGADGTLYVAQTLDSSITSIPNAATRSTPVVFGTSTLTKGGSLNGPLGLVTAPNGDIIAVNGNDGNIVEVDPQGHQVATVTLIPSGAGDLFGLAISSDGTGLLYTNDGTNALDLFHPGAVVSPTAIPTNGATTTRSVSQGGRNVTRTQDACALPVITVCRAGRRSSCRSVPSGAPVLGFGSYFGNDDEVTSQRSR